MKFELKNVSFSPRLSEETNAFAASVYVDGIKAGDARNDGGGGITMVSLHKLSAEKQREINEWIRQQPPKVYPASQGMKSFSVTTALETIVDDLFEKWLDQKHSPEAQIKKWCKTKIVVRLKNEPDSFITFKKDAGKYTKRLRDFIHSKYGDQIEQILNEKYGELVV